MKHSFSTSKFVARRWWSFDDFLEVELITWAVHFGNFIKMRTSQTFVVNKSPMLTFEGYNMEEAQGFCHPFPSLDVVLCNFLVM